MATTTSTDTKAMLDTHPREFDLDADRLARVVDALAECATTCTQCADACLGEDDPAAMVRCIRLDLDCADICTVASRVLARQTEYDPEITRTQLEACIAACRACGEECGSHGEHMDHCRVCAESCRRCEQACRELLESIQA